MSVLIKNATIIHQGSVHHMTQKDILVSNGIIEKIDRDIIAAGAEIIAGQDLYCCVGLCDIGTHSGEPGYEHRETIDSLTRSALSGGYTTLAVFPNTKPITQSKADIQYLKDHSHKNGVQILPIGALSKDCKGVDIAEYMDMKTAGAVAFSDGMKSIDDTGLMSRALLYASQSKGIIIHHPDDHHLSHSGEMHEGEMSTSLGLKGVPDLSELHHVQRDILLNEYNNGNLILHTISAARSVAAIQAAKMTQPSLSSTVSYMNLVHTDADMYDFDSNLKVLPVLRSEGDKTALISGLKVGTIDAIVSNHTPLDEETKNLEFTYALPGAIGLETCLMTCVDSLSNLLDISLIVDKLTLAPRRLLGISVPAIEVGATANLCVFDTKHSHTYRLADIQSSAKNSPYLDKQFNTKVLATIVG